MNEKTIDVHGMSPQMAKKEIERFIAKCDHSVDQVRVIHGYRSGDILKRFIQGKNNIQSKRIRTKKYTTNQGETIFVLEKHLY